MSCNSCSCKLSAGYSCEACHCTNAYCDLCESIYSPITEFYSCKFTNLENNYPVKKCLCHNYGTNPRYYNPPYVPCDCSKKCYPK